MRSCKAREQAHSSRARRDRKRRQVLIEGSFADAANNHGFKRSRWRRLWRQQIQDWMIAGIQNIRIFLKAAKNHASGANAISAVDFGPGEPVRPLFEVLTRRPTHPIDQMTTFLAQLTSARWPKTSNILSLANAF